jgi:hypothetical protein
MLFSSFLLSSVSHYPRAVTPYLSLNFPILDFLFSFIFLSWLLHFQLFHIFFIHLRFNVLFIIWIYKCVIHVIPRISYEKPHHTIQNPCFSTIPTFKILVVHYFWVDTRNGKTFHAKKKRCKTRMDKTEPTVAVYSILKKKSEFDLLMTISELSTVNVETLFFCLTSVLLLTQLIMRH